MRIGIITGEYPPMEGGVGDFTHQLGKALNGYGHEIHILTTAVDEEEESESREDDLTVHRKIRDWGWGTHTLVTRWINAVSPDVINIQYQAAAYQMKGGITLYPRWQKRYLSAPLVVTFHDLLPPYIFPKAGPLRQWTVWQLAQHANGIIVTNGDDYGHLTKQLAEEVPPLRLIPIGSNIAPNPPKGFNPKAWRAEHRFSPDDILIGFFGFLNRSKGVETLIEAVARLAAEDLPVQLLFIGGRTGSSDITNARYANEIDALIEHCGIGGRVRRTGFAMPADISAALLSVDICALPYRDGANLRRGTLHAALAHGAATITTTPVAETSQLYDGENVVFVPPEDVDVLAEAIRSLWHDPQKRLRLGKAAAALAQEFSWDRIAAHTAEFFRALVRG